MADKFVCNDIAIQKEHCEECSLDRINMLRSFFLSTESDKQHLW